MILHPTNFQHIDFNDWLANCPVQWFKLDSDDDQQSYQFIIDTSEEDDEDWLQSFTLTFPQTNNNTNTVMNNELDYSADFDYSGDWTDKDDLDNILDGNIQENFDNETQQLLNQFWWTTTTPSQIV